jgi:hypothetical protein
MPGSDDTLFSLPDARCTDASAEPDVGIVIPTYNRAARLRACLQSVVDDGESGAEVVVVDDGSEDATQEVVKAFGPVVQCVTRPTVDRPLRGTPACSRFSAGTSPFSIPTIALSAGDDPGSLLSRAEQRTHPEVGARQERPVRRAVHRLRGVGSVRAIGRDCSVCLPRRTNRGHREARVELSGDLEKMVVSDVCVLEKFLDGAVDLSDGPRRATADKLNAMSFDAAYHAFVRGDAVAARQRFAADMKRWGTSLPALAYWSTTRLPTRHVRRLHEWTARWTR